MDYNRAIELFDTAVISFLCGLGVAFGLVFMWPKDDTPIKAPEKPTPQVEIVSQTNQVDRTTQNPNTDWFSGSSNYIWDDWKIK